MGGKPKAFEESIFRKMRTLAVSLACKACPRLRGVPRKLNNLWGAIFGVTPVDFA